MSISFILSSLAVAVVSSAATVGFGKLHRRPEGKCRRHKTQAEYKGVRLGAVDPNWYCSRGGGHYVDRTGREYEPTTEKAATVGLVAAGLALLLARFRA